MVSNNIENSTVELADLILRVSSPEVELSQSMFNFSSATFGYILIIVVVLALFLIRSRNTLGVDDESQAITESLDPMERLDRLMNKDTNEDDAISGGVDKSEIEAALNQSKPILPTLDITPNIPNLQPNPQLPEMPVLPKPPSAKVFGPPPIPPEGIPPGWTMEQWIHYGHQWLKENRK